MAIISIARDKARYFKRYPKEAKKQQAGIKHDWTPSHLRRKLTAQEAEGERQKMRVAALSRLGE
jgi:hypothetical protein